MASIFKRKRTVTDANGKKRVKRSASWYIEFKDENGKVRRVKGYRDLAATRQRAAELERQAERCQAGLTDRYAEHKKRPLSEHLADFGRSLAVGNSESHVRITRSRITRVFDGCGFCFWGDIQGSKIIGFLDHVKKRNGEKISNKTFNHYLTSVRTFCSWMLREQRAGESPVGHLKRLRTTETDRRPFDFDEVCRLLATTEKEPYRFGRV